MPKRKLLFESVRNGCVDTQNGVRLDLEGSSAIGVGGIKLTIDPGGVGDEKV